jgi:hypothetical protein
MSFTLGFALYLIIWIISTSGYLIKKYTVT